MIRSFLTSSAKRLKTRGKNQQPCNCNVLGEDTTSGWNVKKKLDEKSVFGRREDPAEDNQLKISGEDEIKLEEVGFKDQDEPRLTPDSSSDHQLRVFDVPRPISTKKSRYCLKQLQNEASKISFFNHCGQDQVDLDGTQGNEDNVEVREKTFHFEAYFQGKFDDYGSCKRQENEERFSEFHPDKKSQFGDSKMTKLQKLKQFLTTKKQEEAEAQNQVIQMEEQAVEAVTKAMKAEKALIRAEDSGSGESGFKAIQAEKSWTEAENHLKEILKKSSASIEKAEELTNDVEGLVSKIKELVTQIEIGNFKKGFNCFLSKSGRK